MQYFDLTAYQMGNAEDPTGMVDQARKVEEWARQQIHLQGLEDSPEVFDYLVKDWAAKQGLSQYTNKQVLLGRIYQAITAKPKTPDNRSKIKEITAKLQAEAEASKNRIRAIAKAKQAKLEADLAKAYTTIKQKDRALKSATPTKGK